MNQNIKESDGTKKLEQIEFSISNENYLIEFDTENKSFIYTPSLTLGSFYGTKKPIVQTRLSNSEKLNIFFSAITTSSGNDKALSNLYIDSIKIYGKNPSFEFLINIFVKIYNNIELCVSLFKEFNKNLKSNVEVSNANLQKFKETFQDICDKSENIVKSNPEINTNYYGLILCYLNNYDFQKFSELVKHLYAQDSTILFQILLTYKSYFKKDIKVEEKILDEFIKFTAGRTFNDLTVSGLIYLKNLKVFLRIIKNNMEKLINIENFKPLELNNLENKMDQKDINEIIELVDNIIKYSKKNNKLLIFFIDKFWENLINICNSSTKENIIILSDLREIFENYFKLVNDLYKKGKILENAINFNKKDKFDLTLHNNIKEFLKKEKNIPNIDIINFIMTKDPVYINEKNINKRDHKIFDKIDFDNIDNEFIETYKKYNFEIVFKKEIVKYLTNLFNKVKNWDNFNNIFNLIKEENLPPPKKSDYINLLKSTYKKLIEEKKNTLTNLKDEELSKIVEFLSYLTDFMYINDYDFLSKKISKLELEIRNKIYIKLIAFCKDEKHKNMKEYIKDYYINGLNLENLDEFIIFIESLEYDDNIDVMDRINNKYQITPEDFYATKETKSKNKDIKIVLLYKLNNRNLIIKENNKYFDNSSAILKDIYEEIENKKIKISQLKSLFDCKEEDYIKDKLGLFIMLQDKNVDIEELFERLKNDYDEIINKLEDLKYISSNLEKYYSKFYEKQISEINHEVEAIDGGTYEDYENKKTSLTTLLDLKEEADKINKVKKLDLFGILYRNTKGSDQNEHFKNALKKLDNISLILKSEDPENKKILEEVKKNNVQINKEIKDYFTQKNSDDELSLLVNFGSFEKDIQSIFYFFDNFHNDENWNKNIIS